MNNQSAVDSLKNFRLSVGTIDKPAGLEITPFPPVKRYTPNEEKMSSQSAVRNSKEAQRILAKIRCQADDMVRFATYHDFDHASYLRDEVACDLDLLDAGGFDTHYAEGCDVYRHAVEDVGKIRQSYDTVIGVVEVEVEAIPA